MSEEIKSDVLSSPQILSNTPHAVIALTNFEGNHLRGSIYENWLRVQTMNSKTDTLGWEELFAVVDCTPTSNDVESRRSREQLIIGTLAAEFSGNQALPFLLAQLGYEMAREALSGMPQHPLNDKTALEIYKWIQNHQDEPPYKYEIGNHTSTIRSDIIHEMRRLLEATYIVRQSGPGEDKDAISVNTTGTINQLVFPSYLPPLIFGSSGLASRCTDEIYTQLHPNEQRQNKTWFDLYNSLHERAYNATKTLVLSGITKERATDTF